MYDFATAPFLNFLIYEENFTFFFISVLYSPLVRLSLHDSVYSQARLAELPGSTTPAPVHQKPLLQQRPPMRRYKSELSWRPAAVQSGVSAQNIINAAAATAAAAPRVKRSESEYCFTTLATSLQVELGVGHLAPGRVGGLATSLQVVWRVGHLAPGRVEGWPPRSR